MCKGYLLDSNCDIFELQNKEVMIYLLRKDGFYGILG